MLRKSLLYLSNQQRVFRFVRNNRLARGFARRFVAGETLDDAIAAVRGLNAQRISASLDLLGESVHNAAEARAGADEYVKAIERIAAERLDANVSLKLTAMGLDVSRDLCVENVCRILKCAHEHDTFVRIDMEGSDYTDITLDLFEHRFYPSYSESVGIVLQSMLRRTMADVERAVRLHARVRLCKGAYKEPASIAYPDKADVDTAYVQAMRRLLCEGRYPGIATHDEKIIEETKRFAGSESIPPDRYEFQMLYGVRRDLQQQLVDEGYRLRVYVPYGTQWYPYLMRRLAERPANLWFITGSLLKERRARRR